MSIARFLSTKFLHRQNTHQICCRFASDSKPIKDVLLYSYENKKFFNVINLCAVSQYFFWGYFAHFCFKEMRDAPVKKDEITENTPWYMKINLGENKFKNILGAVSLAIGFGGLGLAWMYTFRSIRYLVLHKGGDKVTLITYTPIHKNRMITMDLNRVSCQQSRSGSRVHLPIKLFDKYWYFLMDMRGTFRNPVLFDHTVGLKRTFKR